MKISVPGDDPFVTAGTRASSRLKDAPVKDSKAGKDSKRNSGGGEGSPEAAPGPALPTKPMSMQLALASCAARLRAKHFGEEGASGMGLETDGVLAMRKMCEDLPTADEKQLQALFDALEGANSVSVFELLGSGAIRQLLNFLSGKDLKESASRGQEPGGADCWEEKLLSRLQRFIKVSLSPGSGSTPALTSLIRKLQAALSSLETFPLTVAPSGGAARSSGGMPPGGSRGGGGFASRFGMRGGPGGAAGASAGNLNSGLAMLAHPLKLRLSRHPAEKQLRDYSSNVVMIEPLASMTAIEEFLHPRVHRASNSPEAVVPTLAATAAAAASAAAIAEDAAKAAATALRADEANKKSAALKGRAGAASGSAAAAAAAASSKARPIPNDRRMTRAQLAAIGSKEEDKAVKAVSVKPGGVYKRRAGGGHQPLSDEEDEEEVSVREFHCVASDRVLFVCMQ